MIATHPYIRYDAKKWRKELAETMVKKGLEKMKMESEKRTVD